VLARDGPAQLFQPLALVGIAAHGCVQAETMLVGTEHQGVLDA